MNLASLQRLESQLSTADGILNQQELCGPAHRQLRNNLRSALGTVATERVLAESQAARRMIRQFLAGLEGGTSSQGMDAELYTSRTSLSRWTLGLGRGHQFRRR